MGSQSTSIRDLIYFDFNKAASLYSQIDGGLLQETRVTIEDTQGNKKSGELSISMLKGQVAGEAQEKTSLYESRALHHSLLSRLEEWMIENGLLCDLNDVTQLNDFSNERIRQRLQYPSFVSVEGYAAFQDYSRFNRYMSGTNDMLDFFHRATTEEIEKSDLYRAAMALVEDMKKRAEAEKNSAVKGQKRKEAAEAENQLQGLIPPVQGKIAEWQVNGFKKLIEVMMPDRIDLLIAPYKQNPDFKVVANMKRDCFLDTDLNFVMSAYGVRPNNQITVLGLTTDIPPKPDEVFDPFEDREGTTDQEKAFEQVMRSIFTAVNQLEKMVRFAAYPSIAVYPIAVYQRLGSLLPQEQGIEIPDAENAISQ